MIIDMEITLELDATGLKCPEPLMLVRNRLMDMHSGQIIKIIATDPSTLWDFSNFCKFLHHKMLHHEKLDQEYHYWIRKG